MPRHLGCQAKPMQIPTTPLTVPRRKAVNFPICSSFNMLPALRLAVTWGVVR